MPRNERLIAARRNRNLTQKELASALGVTTRTIRAWECGTAFPQPAQLRGLIAFMDVRSTADLGMPASNRRGPRGVVSPQAISQPETITTLSQQRLPEVDDMNRRELLRLMSMAGTLLTSSGLEMHIDWERLNPVANKGSRLDIETVEQYGTINAYLWSTFASAKSKADILPAVRQQLDIFVDGLRWSRSSTVHKRLCALLGDLFQLAGEIFFDCNQYTEAAHCYTLAATAGKEAEEFDIWACAMIRQAYIGVYERRFDRAAPLLELAAGLAKRGDSSLSTRYWVKIVNAQAQAGIGDSNGCKRDLGIAQEVNGLSGRIHNGRWLRFDGSRLAEETGACYVELGKAHLAEAVLLDALRQNRSARRRGCVLTDLATVGVLRHDPIQIVMYGEAALDAVRQTGSGVVGRKLQCLQHRLEPFFGDRHVRHLAMQISDLVARSVN